MKSLSICAGLAAVAISFGAANAAWAANPGNSHLLVIDRKVLFTTSKLGENIRQQIMSFQQKMQSQFGPQSQALQNEQQALDAAKLPAAERAKKSKDLQTRQTAFQQKVRDQQMLMQGGQMAARKYFLDQLDSVVHTIMAEKGADVVLEKSTVVASGNGSDITKEAVQRLDQKAPSFKVPMVKPSMQDMLQMQGAAMQQGQQ